VAAMFDARLIAALTLAYLGGLFLVARAAERSAATRTGPAPVWPYALGLSVYCTSWSIFGTTGQIATTGWIFPPTYIGTLVLFAVGVPFLRKLTAASAARNITSIADFLASRYGKSRALAVMTTCAATIAAAPYIALQFKAVADSLDILAGGEAFPIDSALVVALVMGAFALMFGVGRLSDSGRNQGLIAAVAADGAVKLAAMAAVGVYAVFALHDGPGAFLTDAARAGLLERTAPEGAGQAFAASVVLGALAMVCLPQLFFVVTAAGDLGRSRLRRAGVLFSAYLAVMGLATWPIWAASELAGVGAPAGYHALLLPLETGAPGIALAVFVGGVAAATSIVIAATVAVGVMVGNEIVAPFFVRGGTAAGDADAADLAASVRASRRLAIGGLVALAYAYYRLADETASLASIGLTSMILAAQFAPGLLGAVYWRRGTALGVGAGLAAGAGAWALVLFAPAGEAAASGLGVDRHALALALSLALNAAAFAAASLARPEADAATQTDGFIEGPDLLPETDGAASIEDLVTLAARLIGREAAEEAFAAKFGDDVERAQPADGRAVVFAERLIAGVVGAASARILLRALLERNVAARDVATFAEEASRAYRFNRELLQASMDNVSIGIAVVDPDLRMVAWNKAYEDLFPYPDGLLVQGRHVRELLKHNARRGFCGPGDPDELVERRLRHIRARTSYSFERSRDDGRVVQVRGNPVPGGGFVTSYAEITELANAVAAERELSETLERRVLERTEELEAANAALRAAKKDAEDATASKTRMFAAVGHDVLQPLNAARLLASALGDAPLDGAGRETLFQLNAALTAVQDLLGEVLELTRLDAVAETPRIEPTPLGPLLAEVAAAAAPMAERKGLRLRLVDTRLVVRTDPRLLRRVLGNLASNAVRYTQTGGVVIGARRIGDRVRIDVADTGPGVAEADRERIFREFQRLPGDRGGADRGLGLGLAIVERISRLLGHEIRLRSEPGRGSVFSVAADRDRLAGTAAAAPAPGAFAGLRVLCVDDDPAIRAAMRTVLEGWGCDVTTTADGDGLARRSYDVVFIDHRLADGDTGAAVADRIVERCSVGCIISADRTLEPRAAAAERGYGFVAKPVRDAQLRAVLQSAVARSAAE